MRYILLLALAMLITSCNYFLDSMRGMPDFTVTTYDDETFTLSEQQGQVIILHFWGSWCAPCRDTMQILQEINEEHEEVTIIGLTYLDLKDEASKFVEETAITFVIADDIDLVIADQFNVTGVPETFVLNPQGEILDHFIGIISKDDITSHLQGETTP